MMISLNGEDYTTEAATLDGLLVEAGFATKVATARNGAFVPAGARPDTPIEAGDRIEVLSAMQGG